MEEIKGTGEEEETTRLRGVFTVVRGCFVMYEREKTLCEGGQKEKGDNSRHPSEINLDPRLIWCVWVEMGGWILNLRQEL